MSKDTQISFSEFQSLIRTMYMEKDVERGIDGTFMWLMEEVGELAAALRSGSEADKSEEFADVLAWLTTIANVPSLPFLKGRVFDIFTTTVPPDGSVPRELDRSPNSGCGHGRRAS